MFTEIVYLFAFTPNSYMCKFIQIISSFLIQPIFYTLLLIFLFILLRFEGIKKKIVFNKKGYFLYLDYHRENIVATSHRKILCYMFQYVFLAFLDFYLYKRYSSGLLEYDKLQLVYMVSTQTHTCNIINDRFLTLTSK